MSYKESYKETVRDFCIPYLKTGTIRLFVYCARNFARFLGNFSICYRFFHVFAVKIVKIQRVHS